MFLSYLNRDSDRLPVLDAIYGEAESSQVHIVTSTIAIAEVVFAASEQQGILDPSVESAIIDLFADAKIVTLADVTPAIAHRSRTLQRQGKVGNRSIRAMDALHLATADLLRPSAVHTYDEDWYRWMDPLDLEISAPKTQQPRMI